MARRRQALTVELDPVEAMRDALQIERVPVDSLTVDPANVRRHPEKNLEAIKGSLRKFSQQKPIVVGRNNVVIAGNGTLEAARALHWTHIDIVRTDLTGSDATAYAISDNRTAETALWDEDALGALLQSLPSLEGTGFGEDDLASLLGAGDLPTGDAPTDDHTQSTWGVVIEVDSELDQLELLERFREEGLRVRPLVSGRISV